MQRPGKMKKAALGAGNGFALLAFFESARSQLEKEGYEDEAFYFEQVETWLRDGKQLPTSDREVAKVLGL